MNYGCILLIILGLVTAIVGLYISRGNGELLKPFGTKKTKNEIRKAGRATTITGLVIALVFLIIFLLTM